MVEVGAGGGAGDVEGLQRQRSTWRVTASLENADAGPMGHAVTAGGAETSVTAGARGREPLTGAPKEVGEIQLDGVAAFAQRFTAEDRVGAGGGEDG